MEQRVCRIEEERKQEKACAQGYHVWNVDAAYSFTPYIRCAFCKTRFENEEKISG